MATRDQIVQWLKNLHDVLIENKEYLTELDSAIGDADHGINMKRGFDKVVDKLPTVADKDIGSIMKTTGMALISSVGGAAGPLYGTFFMRGGMAAASKEKLTGEDIVEMLQSGVEGVVQRGRAELGDKTMVDALTPGVDAMRESLENGDDTITALEAGVDAAEQGMKDTIPMQAKKGRASYLGERSIGHQDPGATSSYLILKTLLETLKEDGESDE
ncbi:MAG: dihydroxyacetone kinase subunit DhaL [Candidatus Promineifilaceae bacterium]|nr:dihydroxyacetone kinase subunit DhaL [Candidatus Promineifilaceae bacterium]